jgi:hypothetical protein
MRFGVVFVLHLLVLACSPFTAWADTPTCIIRVEGDEPGSVRSFHDTAGGLLRTVRIKGDPTGWINEIHDVPGGLLLAAENGLFRYDGKRIVRVEGDPTGWINEIHDVLGELLLAAKNGLFRYVRALTVSRVVRLDGTRFTRGTGCY